MLRDAAGNGLHPVYSAAATVTRGPSSPAVLPAGLRAPARPSLAPAAWWAGPRRVPWSWFHVGRTERARASRWATLCRGTAPGCPPTSLRAQAWGLEPNRHPQVKTLLQANSILAGRPHPMATGGTQAGDQSREHPQVKHPLRKRLTRMTDRQTLPRAESSSGDVPMSLGFTRSLSLSQWQRQEAWLRWKVPEN